MGNTFSFGVLSDNDQSANEYLNLGIQEVQRIENLLSEYNSNSETTKINSHADCYPVSVSKETFQLIKRSIAISRISDGAFDITIGALKKLYRFNKRNQLFPAEEEIKAALKKVGYEKIILDEENCSIRFNVKGMHLSFAAIGKGYAADSVISMWQCMGLTSGFVSASGDIRAIGTNEKGAWNVGIADPSDPKTTILRLSLQNNSIATSGNYERHFQSAGIKYSHNINPKDGMPCQFIESVTVVSPSAELSDALATALYVQGRELGFKMVDQLSDSYAILIDESDNIYLSKNIKYENFHSNHLLLACQ